MPCLSDSLLSSLVENALDGEARARAKEHLADCSHCLRLLNAVLQAEAPSVASSATAERDRLDRYVLLEPLGAGGMGVVVKAYDPVLERKVAIKLWRSEAVPAAARDLLLTEARTMARLSHPNVVQVYEVGWAGDQIFIVMEYVSGRTLAEHLSEAKGSLGWRQVLDLFLPAATALLASHAQGVVHRDFKPSNVLVGDDGRVRVIDFGLAGVIGGGTPAYAAPEQQHGAEASSAADQYSFCFALCEALPPGRSAPAALQRVLSRGMSALPENRLPSMEALVLELTRIVRATRHRRVALAAAVSLGLVGAIGAASIHFHQHRCDAPKDVLAGLGDAKTLARVRHALLATGAPFAQASADAVETTLQSYAAQWERTRSRLCEMRHTQVQSPEMQERASVCLERRREEGRAMVELLRGADVALASEAPFAVLRLPDPARCAEGGLLPQLAGSAEDRLALARLWSLSWTGNRLDTLPRSRALRASAERAGNALLAAEAGLIEALKAADTAESRPPVIDRLLEVLWTAMSSGNADLESRAAGVLSYVEGFRGAKYAQGLRWARHAQAVAQRSGSVAKILTAEAIGFEAMNLMGEGRHREAYERFQVAQAAYKDAGALRPEYDRILAGLSSAARVLGLNEQAKAYAVEKLEFVTRLVGPNHPRTARARNAVGQTRVMLGDLAGGRKDFEAAIAVAQAAGGRDHLDYSNDLATLLDFEGDAEAAVLLYQKILQTGSGPQGQTDPELAMVRVNLGLARLDGGRLDEAGRDLYEALLSLREANGEGHPMTIAATNGWGEYLVERRRFAEAVTVFERPQALEDQRRDPFQRIRALLGLGRAKLGQGRASEAAKLLELALEATTRQWTAPDLVAGTRFHLARALWAMGQPARATMLAREAVDALAGRRGFLDCRRAEIQAWLRQHPSRVVSALMPVP